MTFQAVYDGSLCARAPSTRTPAPCYGEIKKPDLANNQFGLPFIIVFLIYCVVTHVTCKQ